MTFSQYLNRVLNENKIDVSVYHSYLMGILEDSLDEDEKREMVLDIVSSLIVSQKYFNYKSYGMLLTKKYFAGNQHGISRQCDFRQME